MHPFDEAQVVEYTGQKNPWHGQEAGQKNPWRGQEAAQTNLWHERAFAEQECLGEECQGRDALVNKTEQPKDLTRVRRMETVRPSVARDEPRCDEKEEARPRTVLGEPRCGAERATGRQKKPQRNDRSVKQVAKYNAARARKDLVQQDKAQSCPSGERGMPAEDTMPAMSAENTMPAMPAEDTMPAMPAEDTMPAEDMMSAQPAEDTMPADVEGIQEQPQVVGVLAGGRRVSLTTWAVVAALGRGRHANWTISTVVAALVKGHHANLTISTVFAALADGGRRHGKLREVHASKD
jgi:hypothetical protein